MVKLSFLIFAIFIVATEIEAETLDQSKWIALIEIELGKSCIVGEPEVGIVLVGNNGLRNEQWVLNTCKGIKEYSVSFYPKESFPQKKSEYEVEKEQ